MKVEPAISTGRRGKALWLAVVTVLCLSACGDKPAEPVADAVDPAYLEELARQQALLQQQFDALAADWPKRLAQLDARITAWKAAAVRAGVENIQADAAWLAQEEAARGAGDQLEAWQKAPAVADNVTALEQSVASLQALAARYQGATKELDAYVRAREQALQAAREWEQLARQQLALGETGEQTLAGLQKKEAALFSEQQIVAATLAQRELAAFHQGWTAAGRETLQVRAEAVAARERWQDMLARSGPVPAAALAQQHWQAAGSAALQGDLPTATTNYRQAADAWVQARHDGLVKLATPDTVALAGGSVRMGDLSGRGQRDEKPVLSVTLRPFAMAVTETTFTQFDAYAEAAGADAPSDNGWGRGAQPVIHVTLAQIEAYARWLSTQTGQRWRLPTEAEWEYAARAGGEKDYGSSDSIIGRANCEGCSQWGNKSTRKVGSYAANAYGIRDLLGNAWEWTASCYTENYETFRADQVGSNCAQYALRGGSWSDLPTALRVSNRTAAAPGDSNDRMGFRLVRETAP